MLDEQVKDLKFVYENNRTTSFDKAFLLVVVRHCGHRAALGENDVEQNFPGSFVFKKGFPTTDRSVVLPPGAKSGSKERPPCLSTPGWSFLMPTEAILSKPTPPCGCGDTYGKTKLFMKAQLIGY